MTDVKPVAYMVEYTEDGEREVEFGTAQRMSMGRTGEPLVRLSDYEALAAELARLRGVREEVADKLIVHLDELKRDAERYQAFRLIAIKAGVFPDAGSFDAESDRAIEVGMLETAEKDGSG